MSQADLAQALAQADIAALSCPLTPQTEGLMVASALTAQAGRS
jgi:phosphoglycerate dehydrogenase-like enzyme